MPARVQLAPETIAALLGGIVDGRTTSDLAAELGLNWYTANWWARRERTGVPWAEPVAPYSCTVCGEAGIGTPRRAIHPACETAWRNAYASGRRRAGIAKPSTPYVETYREEHPDGRARDRLAERERVRHRGREPDISRPGTRRSAPHRCEPLPDTEHPETVRCPTCGAWDFTPEERGPAVGAPQCMPLHHIVHFRGCPGATGVRY